MLKLNVTLRIELKSCVVGLKSVFTQWSRKCLLPKWFKWRLIFSFLFFFLMMIFSFCCLLQGAASAKPGCATATVTARTIPMRKTAKRWSASCLTTCVPPMILSAYLRRSCVMASTIVRIVLMRSFVVKRENPTIISSSWVLLVLSSLVQLFLFCRLVLFGQWRL